LGVVRARLDAATQFAGLAKLRFGHVLGCTFEVDAQRALCIRRKSMCVCDRTDAERWYARKRGRRRSLQRDAMYAYINYYLQT
jgi:hypothetical protein